MDRNTLLHRNITTINDLKENTRLSPDELSNIEHVLKHFPMSITPYYFSLIDWDNYENDPIYRQSVPTMAEEDFTGSFDTSGEASNTKQKGLQHKYGPTALVLTTSACAMYCRHCFRKRLVGQADQKEAGILPDDVAEYVRRHPEINNVLLSGGDAFMNDTKLIHEYLEKILTLDQIDFVRFGTRTPVTFPQRIYKDQGLLETLRRFIENTHKQIYVITQFNHPKEITPESIKAVRALQDTGVILRNQTVLLKTINDDPKVLSKLQSKLTSIGVIPYYVFQCRPVSGVKNQFQVPLKEGVRIVSEAKKMLNGQGKGFRYCMSHPTGKIEILGLLDDELILKYHQAKDINDHDRLFKVKVSDDQGWLD